MNDASRDLACPDLWARSLARSRARRSTSPPSTIGTLAPRGAAVAATLAIAGGAAVLGTPALSTDAAEAAKVRHRGDGVVELQRKLGLAADGVFGPNTRKAVKRWQRRNGLTADGIVGPSTRAKLKIGRGAVLKAKAKPRRRTQARKAKRGAGKRSGGGVKALQRKLGVAADGAFGAQTHRAVKRWQRRNGLTADGVVGPATRAKMGLGRGKVLKRKSGGRARSGGGSSTIGRAIAAGDRIARTPYKWGGGHGSWRDSGYDCSGSVSYVLHAAGLLKRPMASGGFTTYGRPGKGRVISIYANSGHVYMTIGGRRFDTSARSESGSRWSSSGRSSAGYVVRHPAGW